MKFSRLMIVLGLVLALGVGLTLAVQAEVKKPDACKDAQLCANKLRFGVEAFNRSQYRKAKVYFRQAVQADPSSIKAWSYYDLCVMYDAADQVKQAGRIKISDAPVPGSGPSAAAAAAAAPAATAPPTTEAPAAAPPGIPTIPKDEGC